MFCLKSRICFDPFSKPLSSVAIWVSFMADGSTAVMCGHSHRSALSPLHCRTATRRSRHIQSDEMCGCLCGHLPSLYCILTMVLCYWCNFVKNSSLIHNHYLQKIEFSSYIELVVTMGTLSVGMWWLFDRSRGGLSLSVAFTLLCTALTHLLLDPTALT